MEGSLRVRPLWRCAPADPELKENGGTWRRLFGGAFPRNTQYNTAKETQHFAVVLNTPIFFPSEVRKYAYVNPAVHPAG